MFQQVYKGTPHSAKETYQMTRKCILSQDVIKLALQKKMEIVNQLEKMKVFSILNLYYAFLSACNPCRKLKQKGIKNNLRKHRESQKKIYNATSEIKLPVLLSELQYVTQSYLQIMQTRARQ